MGKYEVAGHEPSLLPEGSWEMVWADEFDGTTLDASKWDYRMSMMGLRWPSWTDKAVHLDGKSNVVFTLVEEDGKPVCSQLQTGYNFMDQPEVPTTFGKSHLQWHIGKLHESKYLHSYGYYECRCRMQQRPDAWWSAFWIQSPVIGASLDPADTGVEIDVMEYFERGVVHPHNVFTGGYGLDMSRSRAGGKTFGDLDDFHRFGLLYLNEGQWNGKQLIPKDWVYESTRKQVENGTPYGYGYLFWGSPFGIFRADGKDGQLSYIMREKNAVVTMVSECRRTAELQQLVFDELYPLI